ncbi:efflux RND transporter periplasmic adaptor subunit [Variovorax sp. J22R133]|uniref:efflux RND transporter periplasmic adaptor subunit n=1 Tax=Variovorax brevis TaxID=3053503 RepID=UPI00257783A9|nr:efflux RND transporter periplasmic adaptor subunit [Variovorax sp. J22R133]MDM0116546.1 efflux RND transporter periplasmic adaptor subunit [Variovorax sp. J22R133]
MNRTTITTLAILAALGIAAGAFLLGREAGRTHDAAPASPTAASQAPEAGTDGRKILYWHDPMVPGPRFDKPGKSPFMDMQLVPMYADSESGSGGVRVNAGVQQNLGIRLATVRRAALSSSFDAVGAVQFDERLNVAVQTRVAGYVEYLSVRAPMERVRKGQALATIFAPEWLGPLNELIALQRAGVSQDVVDAARDRLRAMSIPPELVRQSEKAGTAQARFVLSAPTSGVISELGVREGVAVAPGTTLFRIAGLDRVWAVADIPEAQAARLVPGQKVKAELQADASLSFDGRLAEIVPEISSSTRTLKARIELDNGQGRLVPGMLLRLHLDGATSTQLVVPSEAVIRTGKRAVVILRKESGAFEPRDVSPGADLGDETQVLQGLSEGEQVVASGQFLIDSEARLRSVLGAMSAATPETAIATPPTPPTPTTLATPAPQADHGAHDAHGSHTTPVAPPTAASPPAAPPPAAPPRAEPASKP